MTPFTEVLAGGHPNSLGRTPDVVAAVLADRDRLDELFAAIASPDEVVRMRVGDALEKVCRERPDWLLDDVERVLGELGRIGQPSVQWHVAQILDHVRHGLSDDQSRRATALLQHNLSTSTDWIVLNVTMDVLAGWARTDAALASYLVMELERLRHDRRRSVAARATKHLAQLRPLGPTR